MGYKKPKQTKNRYKSIFANKARTELQEKQPEMTNQIKLLKLEKILSDLTEKKNRFVFYCPDIPHPVGMVEIIYTHARILAENGYTVEVLHEFKGFRPGWLLDFDKKYSNVKKSFVNESKGSMGNGYKFLPTDTLIIPDAFWSVMKNFAEQHSQIQKVVLVLGYGGMATIDPGLSWNTIGFNSAIYISEQLENDYQTLFPNIQPYRASYVIDRELFQSEKSINKRPIIALSCSNREQAQRLINIFYNRYPALDFFQFDICKKKSQEQYIDTLKEASLLVLVDPKSGHPQWPLEALSCNTPTMAVRGRGYSHLVDHPNIMLLDIDDDFYIADCIADFAYEWISDSKRLQETTNCDILESYTLQSITPQLTATFSGLQDNVIKYFADLYNLVQSQSNDNNE